MQDQDIIRLATIAKLSKPVEPIIPESVPAWMGQAKRWILYDKNKKPMSPWDGKLIGGGQKATDGHRWLHFHQARELATKHNMGLSIVLGEGVGGIDLDHVRDPQSGDMTAFAKACVALAEQLGAHCELSPTGTGIKIYGQLATVFHKGADCTLKEKIGEAIHQGQPVKVEAGYECWVKDRHFCVTGQSLFPCLQNPVDITPIQRLIESRFPKELPPEPLAIPEGELFFDPRQMPKAKAGESIAEYFNRADPANHGSMILSAMGWTFHHSEPGKLHWTRPGKDKAHGLSGTLFLDHGTFTVYSSAAPLPQGTYSLFQLYSKRFFNGDGSAAGAALRWWKDRGQLGNLPLSVKPLEPVALPAPVPAHQPIGPAVPVANKETGKEGFAVTHVDRLCERYGQIDWVWPNWIARQVLHLVTGEPGAGKTLLLNDVLLTIYGQANLPDGHRPPDSIRAKRVLCIDSDQRIHDTAPKLAKGYFGKEAESIVDVVEWGASATLRPIVAWDDKGGLFDFLAGVLQQGRHWCLVIDTIARFAGAAELNSPKDLSRFIEPLQRIARDCNMPVFLIGHSNSNGDAYGRHIRGACQISWLVKKDSRSLTIDRAFASDPEPLYFDFPKEPYGPLEWSTQKLAKPKGQKATELKQWILKRLEMLATKHTELEEDLSSWTNLLQAASDDEVITGKEASKKQSFNRAIKDLKKTGDIWQIECTGKNGGKFQRYKLRSLGEDAETAP